MIRSTCFGHHFTHHQELESIQIFAACGTKLWLWLVVSVVCGCSLYVRVEGCCSSNIPQPESIIYSHTPHLQPAITKVMCHMLWISV